jgi:enterochelin esterase-like enzyme
VESGTYTSALLDGEVPFRVYLPPCFAPALGPYPMIVALHGKPFSETHWDDLGLDETAEAGIVRGDWPPSLIVMPRVPEPLFSNTDGGPGSYEQELLEGLLPAIEVRYPIDNARMALAGISRGGVWALEIGLRHPEIFGSVAALSPALSLNRARLEYDPLRLDTWPGPLPTRVFLAAGESDWARASTESLARLLQNAGVPPDLLLVPGGHESMVWEDSMRPMLESITAEWGEGG